MGAFYVFFKMLKERYIKESINQSWVGLLFCFGFFFFFFGGGGGGLFCLDRCFEIHIMLAKFIYSQLSHSDHFS